MISFVIVLLASCSALQTQPTIEYVSTEPAQANMPNPASAFCEQQGNRLEIRTAADGSQSGVCILPDGGECDEWAYFRGECGPASPTASPASDSSLFLTQYIFPTSIDPAKRYMFYLHGRIIEDQGIPAVSPEYGTYEYEAILEKLARYGFTVISEQRSKDSNSGKYAERVVGQVKELLNGGVPAQNITVVGASKGASIAILVSNFLENKTINFVLLGSCHADIVTEFKQEGVSLSGNVLLINDYDDEFSGSCEELYQFSEGKGLARHEEIVLQVGTGHGILYKPLDEWILPTVRWATQ
ncbi:MAG: DUF333 domain-containing protein [Chloroflexi bacterium]|nr:DUF333 domain-containing protein [Chloroflexota bacterium]